MQYVQNYVLKKKMVEQTQQSLDMTVMHLGFFNLICMTFIPPNFWRNSDNHLWL